MVDLPPGVRLVTPDTWNSVFSEQFPLYIGNPRHSTCVACHVERMRGRKLLITTEFVLMTSVMELLDEHGDVITENETPLYIEVEGWHVLFSRQHNDDPWFLPPDWSSSLMIANEFLGGVDNMEMNLTDAGGRRIHTHSHTHLLNRGAIEGGTRLYRLGFGSIRLNELARLHRQASSS